MWFLGWFKKKVFINVGFEWKKIPFSVFWRYQWPNKPKLEACITIYIEGGHFQQLLFLFVFCHLLSFLNIFLSCCFTLHHKMLFFWKTVHVTTFDEEYLFSIENIGGLKCPFKIPIFPVSYKLLSRWHIKKIN